MKFLSKYIQSDDFEYKAFYKPIKVKGTIKEIEKRLSNFLSENSYEEVNIDEGNLEVYGKKSDHEITYIIVHDDDGTSRVYLSIYTPHSRFKAKKVLKAMFEETREGLNDIITHNVVLEK